MAENTENESDLVLYNTKICKYHKRRLAEDAFTDSVENNRRVSSARVLRKILDKHYGTQTGKRLSK